MRRRSDEDLIATNEDKSRVPAWGAINTYEIPYWSDDDDRVLWSRIVGSVYQWIDDFQVGCESLGLVYHHTSDSLTENLLTQTSDVSGFVAGHCRSCRLDGG